jgi:hypothetical protein
MDNDYLYRYIIDFGKVNELGNTFSVEKSKNDYFDDGTRGYTLSRSIIKRYINEYYRINNKSIKVQDLTDSHKEIFNNLYYNGILVHISEFKIRKRNNTIEEILEERK